MEWKPIDNYEDFYEVSSDGRVRTVSRKVQIGNHSRIIPSRELKPQKSKDGYLMVCLCKENRKITKKIHRLVAETFINNPNDYPCINHKDENKQNNNVDNLEWCTSLYNTRYGTGIERRANKKRKAIVGTNKNGENVVFPSLVSAAKSLGISHSTISGCLHNKQKTAGGYKWNFIQL